MKAKDLAKMLEGVNPESEVYVDIGTHYDKKKNIVYELIHNEDFGCERIEEVSMFVLHEKGVFEIALIPYDYCGLQHDNVVDEFFEKYGLNKLMDDIRKQNDADTQKALEELKKQRLQKH